MNSVYDPCPCKSGKKFKFCCLAAAKNLESAAAAQVITAWPIHMCFVGRNWQQTGIGDVNIVRKMPHGDFIEGRYLMDIWCLGVKDACITRGLNQYELQTAIDKVAESAEGLQVLSYEDARSIVLGGLAYAAQFGFFPHPDWNTAKCMLEPERAFVDKFTFGRDGKPFYVAGPYDKLRQKEYAKKVSAAGGHWIIPVGDGEF